MGPQICVSFRPMAIDWQLLHAAVIEWAQATCGISGCPVAPDKAVQYKFVM